MSNWDDFKTSSSGISPAALVRASEDRPALTSAEDYAMFMEATFLKVADHFLHVPTHLNMNHVTDVYKSRMRSTKNRKLRTQELRFAYHGFAGSVRYGKVVVTETEYPRGFRIGKFWTGEQHHDRKWISWNEAITNMYSDDLPWT